MLLKSNPSCTKPSFHSPHMAILLRGIKRVQSQAGPRLIWLPITASLMRHIKVVFAGQPFSYNNVLLWAACCTGFFGFLRCGEFLVWDRVQFSQDDYLCLSDISIDTTTPSWTVSLHIKVSKMYQFRQGSTVALGSTGWISVQLQPLSTTYNFGVVALVPFSRWKMVNHYTENSSPCKSNRHYPWQVLIHRLMATAFA